MSVKYSIRSVFIFSSFFIVFLYVFSYFLILAVLLLLCLFFSVFVDPAVRTPHPTFSKSIWYLFRIASDSETYFGFVVDEFLELVHTKTSRCLRHYLWLLPPIRNSLSLEPPVRNTQNLDSVSELALSQTWIILRNQSAGHLALNLNNHVYMLASGRSFHD